MLGILCLIQNYLGAGGKGIKSFGCVGGGADPNSITGLPEIPSVSACTGTESPAKDLPVSEQGKDGEHGRRKIHVVC